MRTKNNGHRLQQEKCSLELRKKNLVWEAVSAFEQVSQRDCEIPILGHFQNSTQQSPGQRDLTLKIALLRVGGQGWSPARVLSHLRCSVTGVL